MGKSKYRLPKYDVSWYAPNRKRPIAYSCEWVMFSLAYEAEDSDETVQQLRDRLNGPDYIPNDEINVVLDAYIKHGCGDDLARNIFKVPRYICVRGATYNEPHVWIRVD